MLSTKAAVIIALVEMDLDTPFRPARALAEVVPPSEGLEAVAPCRPLPLSASSTAKYDAVTSSVTYSPLYIVWWGESEIWVRS